MASQGRGWGEACQSNSRRRFRRPIVGTRRGFVGVSFSLATLPTPIERIRRHTSHRVPNFGRSIFKTNQFALRLRYRISELGLTVFQPFRFRTKNSSLASTTSSSSSWDEAFFKIRSISSCIGSSSMKPHSFMWLVSSARAFEYIHGKRISNARVAASLNSHQESAENEIYRWKIVVENYIRSSQPSAISSLVPRVF